MKRKLNVRFLVFLLIALGVLAGSAIWVRAAQVERTAEALLTQAHRAREQGNLEQAAKFLNRYLAFNPDDNQALETLALTLEQLGAAPRARLKAYLVFERLVSRVPERHDLRRRLVDLAMDLGRFADAQRHLEPLRAALPNDGELLHLVALCHEATRKYDQAVTSYEAAIRLAPAHIDSYTRLAGLYRRRLERAAQADCVLDELVKVNADAPKAYLARARYRREFGPRAEAAKDIARARELAPQDADVIALGAELDLAKGELSAARTSLGAGIELHPKDFRMYHTLALVELRAGQRDDAIKCIRQGLQAIPEQPALLLLLADTLTATSPSPPFNRGGEGAHQEAREILAKLRQRGYQPASVEYLEARQLMNDGKWPEAARALERVRPQLLTTPELAKQVELCLGKCYEQLGDVDRQLGALRRAVSLDPNWLPARSELSAALLTAGRLEDALTEYRQLAALPGAPPAATIGLARLLILRNLQRPAAQRDWTEVEKLLSQAEKDSPKELDLCLWSAEALAGQGKIEQAEAALEQARSAHAKQVAPWLGLAHLAQRRNDPDAAFRILDDAKVACSDSVELRLARARCWLKRGGDNVKAQLARLESDCDTWLTADRARLYVGLAETYQLLGASADAVRLWTSVADLQPSNLRVRFTLFDLAQRTGDDKLMARLLDDIQRIEGEKGPLWRHGEAVRLVSKAKRGDRSGLAAARAHLVAAAGQRRNWAAIPLCEAQIDELEGNLDRAIDNLKKAMELGESNPAVARRLVQLLYERRRYPEADQVVRKMQEQLPLAGDLQRLAAEVSLQTQDHNRAIELARQAVAAESKDYRDYLWLGQVLTAAGKLADGERELRRALALTSKAPEVWLSLVQNLARAGQTDRADAVIREAQEKLPPEAAPLALAHCYEAVGQLDKAEQQFQAALADKPDDVQALRSLAGFCLRTNRPAAAEPHLRRLLEVKAAEADVCWARRSLALVLASRNDYAHAREALALLDRNTKSPLSSADDQRTRARVLVTQKTAAARRAAVRILDDLCEKQLATPEDQFVLAQLLESSGDWPKARARLRDLLAQNGQNSAFLAYYSRALLRRGEIEEASAWLDKLVQIEPTAFRTLESKARLLVAQGETAKAVALFDPFLQERDPKSETAITRKATVAAVFEELGQYEPAEKLLREHVMGRPENGLLLAAYLGRRGRTQEALDLCEPAWKSRPPEAVAEVCLAILRAAPTSRDGQARVERWLTDAVSNLESVPLLLTLADLCDLQGRYTDAEALYRQIIARDNRNLVALNNLAWLLAARDAKSAGEALLFINRAIDAVGPVAELLDTRASVYLALGKPEQALADLEEAVADNASPAKLYRQARAHLLANNRPAASASWMKAKKAGLDAGKLHALEQAAFQQVKGQLDAVR